MSDTTPMTDTAVRLTEKLIDDLKPTGRVYRKWDKVVREFGVIVSRHGVKSYFVQRKVPGRKHPQRKVLGRCCDMSLAAARKRAEEELYKLGLGLDPRVKDLASITLRKGLEIYLAKDKPRPLAQLSKDIIRSLIERWLSDWLDLPIISITHDMIDARHSQIKAKIADDAKPRAAGRSPIDGKASANRVMSYLRIIWNYNLKKKALGVLNPVVGLVLYDENSISRSIPRAKHQEFYMSVVTYLQYDPVFGGAILAMLFTGLRNENIQELLWSEIGEDFIEIPAHKVKYGHKFNKGEPIKIPMNDHLRWIFEEIERICGRHSSGYVFPTQSFRAKSLHITGLTQRISKIGGEIGIVLSAHDLRHTYLGVCLEAKISWIGTKRLAGHSLGKDDDITAAYQEADYGDDELVAEAQKVWRHMARRCGLDVPEPLTEAERMREAENERLRCELARMQANEAENQQQMQRLAEELSAVRSLLESQQQSAR